MVTPMKKLSHLIQSLFIFIAIMFTVNLSMAPVASAASCGSGGNSTATFDLLPAWYDGLCDNGAIKSPAAVGGIGQFLTIIILNVVEIMLYLTGYLSLGFIIWGGFKFMISGENSSGVASARKTILNAVIGLIISIFAVAIVNLVSGAFN